MKRNWHPTHGFPVIGFALVLSLTGCANYPHGPYWENPDWQQQLQREIQEAVTYPDNAASLEFPSGTASVALTYQDGKLTDIHIIKSTGYDVLDKSLLEDISKIKPPAADPAYAHIAHDFQMDVTMEVTADVYNRYLAANVADNLNLPNQYFSHRPASVIVSCNVVNGEFLFPKIMARDGFTPDIDAPVVAAFNKLSAKYPRQYFDVPIPFTIKIVLTQDKDMTVGALLGLMQGTTVVVYPSKGD